MRRGQRDWAGAMGMHCNGQGSPPCSLELTQQTKTLDSVGTREAGLGHIPTLSMPRNHSLAWLM